MIAILALISGMGGPCRPSLTCAATVVVQHVLAETKQTSVLLDLKGIAGELKVGAGEERKLRDQFSSIKQGGVTLTMCVFDCTSVRESSSAMHMYINSALPRGNDYAIEVHFDGTDITYNANYVDGKWVVTRGLKIIHAVGGG